jgi:hypothetical protein
MAAAGDNRDPRNDIMERMRLIEHAHDKHEIICAERWERVRQNQDDAKAERHRMHNDNKEELEKISGRVERLYSRAWAVAGTIIGTEGLIIIGIVGWVMNKSMTHP